MNRYWRGHGLSIKQSRENKPELEYVHHRQSHLKLPSVINSVSINVQYSLRYVGDLLIDANMIKNKNIRYCLLIRNCLCNRISCIMSAFFDILNVQQNAKFPQQANAQQAE